MATVTKCEETYGSRRGSRRARETTTAKEYQRLFTVVYDDKVSDIADVKTADATGIGGDKIPAIGDAYPSDSTATVVNIDPIEQDGSRRHFIVVVRYSTSSDSKPEEDDPVDEDWIIDVPDHQEKKRQDYTLIDTTSLTAGDFKGTSANEPIANAVDDAYEDAIFENTYPPLIECTRNIDVGTLAISEIVAYRGTINNAAVTIAGYSIPKWAGLMLGFSLKETYGRGKKYQILKYRIATRSLLWVRRILNNGFNALQGTDIVPIVLENGERPQKAQNLNIDGTWSLAVIPNYRIFGTIQDADWSALTYSLPAAWIP